MHVSEDTGTILATASGVQYNTERRYLAGQIQICLEMLVPTGACQENYGSTFNMTYAATSRQDLQLCRGSFTVTYTLLLQYKLNYTIQIRHMLYVCMVDLKC